jgi:predicted nucleic-acid-binding protein
MVLDNDRLTLENPDIVAAALTTYRKHARVSFADCLILEAARKAGHLPLGTFDRRLAKLDGVKEL